MYQNLSMLSAGEKKKKIEMSHLKSENFQIIVAIAWLRSLASTCGYLRHFLVALVI
jgi:hypothetical protein